MRGNRQINPAFFSKQADLTAFNNLQQSKNSLKQKYKSARQQGSLNLSSCQPALTEIPKEVLALDAFLEEDEKFWEVEPLRIVDFSFNQIHTIPDEIQNLTDCHTIKLRNNVLNTINDQLFHGCQNLRILDCGCNEIQSISESIQYGSELKEVYLNDNRLSTLPNTLFTLTGLQKLELQDNQLISFEPIRNGSIRFHFPHLIALNLSNNQLTALPLDWSSLTMLESLQCQHNLLEKTPSFQGLIRLKVIDLSQNRLTTFPNLPSPKTVLSQCVLAYNQIRDIPVEFCTSQSHLTELLIHNNRLSMLPVEMECLSSLKILDVSNNSLTDLPPALGYISSLQVLRTEGNAIRTIRQTLLMEPAQKIKAYLRTRGKSLLNPDAESVDPVAAPAGPSALNKGKGVGMSGGSDALENVLYRIRNLSAGLIDLSRCQLDSLDREDIINNIQLMLSNGNGLHSLDLQDNSFTQLPVNFLNCFMIRRCNLTNNQLSVGIGITAFPEPLSYLHALDVSENQLTSDHLEVVLSYCDQLTELVAAHNPLTKLPRKLTQCAQLQKVCFAYCKLKDISSLDFNQLSELEVVDLSNNQITIFSDESNFIQYANKLSVLNLENNDIRDIPVALGKLGRLQTLLLAGNPQKMVRSYVIQKGSAAVIQNLRERATNYPTAEVSKVSVSNNEGSGRMTEFQAVKAQAMVDNASASFARESAGYRGESISVPHNRRQDLSSGTRTSIPRIQSSNSSQRPVPLGESLARRRDGTAMAGILAHSNSQSHLQTESNVQASTSPRAAASDSVTRYKRTEALSRVNMKRMTGGL